MHEGLVHGAVACGVILLRHLSEFHLLQTLWSYAVARYAGLTEPQVWNTFNVYMTLILLQLVLVILNLAPLIAWARDLE